MLLLFFVIKGWLECLNDKVSQSFDAGGGKVAVKPAALATTACPCRNALRKRKPFWYRVEVFLCKDEFSHAFYIVLPNTTDDERGEVGFDEFTGQIGEYVESIDHTDVLYDAVAGLWV